MKSSTLLTFAIFELVLSFQQVLAFPEPEPGKSHGHGHHGKPKDNGCKCFPDSPCWPSDSAWSSLNRTISGRLIHVTPVASVCYRAAYNPTSCAAVAQGWTQHSFHLEQPESIGSPARANDSCNPTADPDEGSCGLGYYPRYVVNATRVEDVQAGVRFARKYNLRLVVKASGHDFQGRSTGFGSLSIWTRHLRGITFSKSFLPSSCPKHKTTRPLTHDTATISAGHVYIEAYRAAQEQGLSLVGGSVGSVAVAGGHIQGGGHGYTSHEYGLAADQALEFEIVLANGEKVIANECSHPELFFALRGGGPSTYGIVTKVTLKAYPSQPLLNHFLIANLTTPILPDGPLHPELKKLATYLYSEVPRLMAGGLGGFFYVLPWGQVLWTLVQVQNRGHKQTPTELVAPMLPRLYSDEFANFTIATFEAPIPNLYELVKSVEGSDPNAAGGSPGVSSSRILPASFFTEESFGPLLENIYPPSDISKGITGLMIGHLVAGGAVNKNSGGAVLPAWRRGLVHLLVTRFGGSEVSKEELKKEEELMNSKWGKKLRDADPDEVGGGAYMNECAYAEPDWQKSLFGKNWKKLSGIKKKYDPDDLFYCWHCVGSEKFSEVDGRVCLKQGRK